MHGVAGSATAQFFVDYMAEPSLSQTHKLVETAAIATERALNNQLLGSARLLCYCAAELVAASRRGDAGFRPEAVGLDIRLSCALLREAEKLVLSAEVAVSTLRAARSTISKFFKWSKTLHATTLVDKSNTPSTDHDPLRCTLKSRDQRKKKVNKTSRM